MYYLIASCCWVTPDNIYKLAKLGKKPICIEHPDGVSHKLIIKLDPEMKIRNLFPGYKIITKDRLYELISKIKDGTIESNDYYGEVT